MIRTFAWTLITILSITSTSALATNSFLQEQIQMARETNLNRQIARSETERPARPMPDTIANTTSEKSPWGAGLLGFFGGFGSGHWYAEGKPSNKAMLWLGLDIGTFLTSAIISNANSGSTKDLTPFLFWVGQRVWQGANAATTASDRNQANGYAQTKPTFTVPLISYNF
jgi:hypothetical protein